MIDEPVGNSMLGAVDVCFGINSSLESAGLADRSRLDLNAAIGNNLREITIATISLPCHVEVPCDCVRNQQSRAM